MNTNTNTDVGTTENVGTSESEELTIEDETQDLTDTYENTELDKTQEMGENQDLNETQELLDMDESQELPTQTMSQELNRESGGVPLKKRPVDEVHYESETTDNPSKPKRTAEQKMDEEMGKMMRADWGQCERISSCLKFNRTYNPDWPYFIEHCF